MSGRSQLLDTIRNKYHDQPVNLVMDNARYQRCYKVINYAQEKDIELLFLPSYSPNLNLIERLWKHLKKSCLRNRYFESFESFQKNIDHYLDELATAQITAHSQFPVLHKIMIYERAEYNRSWTWSSTGPTITRFLFLLAAWRWLDRKSAYLGR